MITNISIVENSDITLPDGSYRWCTAMHPSQPAVARDNSGNWMVLVEHREFDPSRMS